MYPLQPVRYLQDSIDLFNHDYLYDFTEDEIKHQRQRFTNPNITQPLNLKTIQLDRNQFANKATCLQQFTLGFLKKSNTKA